MNSHKDDDILHSVCRLARSHRNLSGYCMSGDTDHPHISDYLGMASQNHRLKYVKHKYILYSIVNEVKLLYLGRENGRDNHIK